MFALSRIHCSTSQRASALAGRLAGAFALFGTSPAAAQVSSEQVFVTPDWAREHAEVWVDARDDVSYALSHHPDAVHLPWTDFTTRSQSGLLLSTDQLQGRLGTAGISRDLTVVVYGEWDRGWGEEGHFFWLLEYLGHDDVHILEGGWAAWISSGGPSTTAVEVPLATEFVADVQPGLLADRDQVLRMSTELETGLILDVRTDEEFQGGRLHGEVRGGRIPGAEHTDWRTLLGSPHPAGPVGAMEVGLDAPIVTYCTGGVRSGFAYAALRAAGYTRVSNYAGSFWEWSADPDLPLASEHK
jgi:thiosulfate/3-mercaptopyruvate sulfurtransferase